MRASAVLAEVERILSTVEIGAAAADTGESSVRVALFPDPSQPGYHQIHGTAIVEAVRRAPYERDRGHSNLHRLDVQVVLIARVRSMGSAMEDVRAAWDIAERAAQVLMDAPSLQMLAPSIDYQGVTDDGAQCAHVITLPIIVGGSP